MSNIQTVQAIYEDFGKGNVPGILARLDPNVDWERHGEGHSVPWLTPGTGVGHVGKFFESLGAIEITKFVPMNLLEGGDQVVAVIDTELTVKATGMSLQDEELHLWTFGPDGKVTGFRHVVDTAKHLAAFKGAPVRA